MGKRFYQITTNARTADIDIYGNITSWPWEEYGEVSARDIKQEINGLDVDCINVYINSYGGEVAEALAIYSALRRHSAKIHTYCDGFACSAATIIFAAGDDRTIGSIALMMIHNCMSYVGYANSGELRKAADDNDKINQSSIEAYKKICNISESKIKAMMDAETWLTAEECLQYGFATEIADNEETMQTQQSAFGLVRQAIISNDKNTVSANQIIDKLDALQAAIDKMSKAEHSPEPAEKTNQKAVNFFKNLF